MLRGAVPIASIVVTYFLSNRLLGPILTEYGDLPRQLGPVVVSMLVGSATRQLTK